MALARALAPEPDVLLLDEPLSALDVSAAVAMRQVLRTLLRGSGRTAVLVTHDLLDVLALADAVVVLDGGRVVEHGPALEVLTRPRSAFAARLAGVNLVLGALAAEGDALVADGAAPAARTPTARRLPATQTAARQRPGDSCCTASSTRPAGPASRWPPPSARAPSASTGPPRAVAPATSSP